MSAKLDRANHLFHATRITLGIIYFHFGILKFFPATSPAEGLAGATIHELTLGWVPPGTAVILLAVFECLLGVILLSNRFQGLAFGLFLFHMLGTFSPFLLLPEVTFNGSWLKPTLEGQYILKNLVLVSGVSAVFVPEIIAGRQPEFVNWKRFAWWAKENPPASAATDLSAVSLDKT